MKTTLKLCVIIALALTISTKIGQTVCYAEEQTTVEVEGIIEENSNVTIDPNAPDYNMWSVPEELRNESNFGPAFDKEEQTQPAENIAQEEAVVAVETPISSNRWGITITPEEREILARIVELECGAEPDIGQQAVIEVVLNRVVDPSYPNTVVGVLSQRRQFSTWKNVNSRRATPTAKDYANIDAVLNGQSNILPFNTVYFSRGAQNKRVQIRIGGHVFCNR